jgi:hypothetical protein
MFGPYLAGVFDVELARRFDETRDAQNARHEVPRHLLASLGEFLREEFVETQHTPESQCQIHIAPARPDLLRRH